MKEKVTKEQINQWKVKYGEVFLLQSGEGEDLRECYVHSPSRQTISAATPYADTNPMKFAEIILDGCWIVGDEDIKTDDKLFMGITKQLGALIQVKEFTLKKL